MTQIKMVSYLTKSLCVYEVAMDGATVWHKEVGFGRGTARLRVETAREQERIAERLLRADDPKAELRLIFGGSR